MLARYRQLFVYIVLFSISLGTAESWSLQLRVQLKSPKGTALALADAVVYLKSVEGQSLSAQQQTAEIVQLGRRFMPQNIPSII